MSPASFATLIANFRKLEGLSNYLYVLNSFAWYLAQYSSSLVFNTGSKNKHPIILGKPHESIIISEKSITLPSDATAPKTIHPKYIA